MKKGKRPVILHINIENINVTQGESSLDPGDHKRAMEVLEDLSKTVGKELTLEVALDIIATERGKANLNVRLSTSPEVGEKWGRVISCLNEADSQLRAAIAGISVNAGSHVVG